MEWLKELLKNAGVENVDDLESKISKELPKHFKPAKEFNDINEELKLVKGEKKTLEDDKKKIEDEYNNFKQGSISQADYEAKKKEIEDNSITLIHTDPPYVIHSDDNMGAMMEKKARKSYDKLIKADIFPCFPMFCWFLS